MGNCGSCNQPFFRQITNNTQNQINVTEGNNWFVNVKNNVTITDGTYAIFSKQVSIDFLCEYVAITVMIDNPDNPGRGDVVPTTAVKINVRDTLSQEAWIWTAGGALATFSPIPAQLFCGIKPQALMVPRTVYQNSNLEVIVEPQGHDILYFNMTFYGRRLDTLPQWERDRLCGDPRTSGYIAIYCDPLNLPRADTLTDPCAVGPEVEGYVRIPTLPFDIFVAGMSGFLADPSNTSIPVGKALAEFKIIDSNNKNMIMQEYAPTNILPGSIMYSPKLSPTDTIPCDSEQINIAGCCGNTMMSQVGWRVRSNSAIQILARSIHSPMNPDVSTSQYFHLMLHGFRVPSSEIAAGYPYYNRNSADLRCPPDSSGVAPGAGYVSGPCPPHGLNGGFDNSNNKPLTYAEKMRRKHGG